MKGPSVSSSSVPPSATINAPVGTSAAVFSIPPSASIPSHKEEREEVQLEENGGEEEAGRADRQALPLDDLDDVDDLVNELAHEVRGRKGREGEILDA